MRFKDLNEEVNMKIAVLNALAEVIDEAAHKIESVISQKRLENSDQNVLVAAMEEDAYEKEGRIAELGSEDLK